MRNLAKTLAAMDDLDGARELAEDALSIHRRVHGFEHPDTLAAEELLNSLHPTDDGA